MIKKIDILGMSVDNYTVRESLLRLDTYMNSTVLNIIETVTMKQLVSAAENTKIKECLEQADLCVIGEKEILSETGNATVQRIREIRDQDFMHELLKRVVRNQKRVFLLASTRNEIENMQAFFTETSPKIAVAGSYAIEECVGDMDTIVNEINGATPDMVISALDSPTEEEFVLSHKDKIGASIWYGVGTSYNRKQSGLQVGATIKKLALRGRLHHSVSKYQNEIKDRK